MSGPPRVRFDPGGIEVEGGLLWLDAKRPKALGVITHAHGDHVARHETILCTGATAEFVRRRNGPGPRFIELAYDEPFAVGDLSLTLLPAGHILGSAMAHIQGPHGSLLYTGDVRPEGGLTCEPARVRKADHLITEATFGRPDHRFPPSQESRARLVEFAAGALASGQVPVFLVYALGKGQEVLAALTAAGIPTDAHGSIWELCEVYRAHGVRFPGARRLTPEVARARAIVVPPRSRRCHEVRARAPLRVAAVTGWGERALGQGIHEAIRLSDHADFEALLGLVRAVGPSRVSVLHGYAEEFARELRALGFAADAVAGHAGPAEGARPGMFGSSRPPPP